MFHLMLVLPGLILVGFVLCIIVVLVLFAILAIASAMIGGTTVALLIKNARVKKLCLLGFLILFLIGILCLTPILTIYFSLPASFFLCVVFFIYVCLIVLSIAGIKISCPIKNRVGKTILITLFSVVLFATVSLIMVTAYIGLSLTL